MADQANPRLMAAFKTYSRVASTAIIIISCLVLAGWVMDIEMLKRIFPGVVAMNPMTALNFILAGAAVWLLQSTSPTLASRRVVHGFACFIAVIGLLRIIALTVGWDSGTDQLLFRSKLDLGPPPPNRIAPNTAFNFVLIGLALWLIDSKWRSRAQSMAVMVAAFSLLAVIGYLYGAASFYKVKTYIPMALHTATSFTLLATAILCARPNRGLMGRVVSNGAGGLMLRRMLIFTIGLPILLGWVMVAVRQNDIYDESLRLAIYVVLIMVVFGNMVRINALSLDRQERERQRAEELMRASEERYRTLVVATTQIVWTTDAQGQVEDMPDWRATTGQTLEEVKGWGWLEAIHPDDRERTAQIWSHAVATRGIYDTEYRIRQRDGGYRHFLVRGVPVLMADGGIREWVGTCTDIDDQQRAREETIRAREAAEAATIAKSEFLANMSHELRTPLNAIIGFSEVLEDETFGPLNARQTRYVGNILNSGRHLLQLINDILDIAKIEAGRLTLDRAPFPVAGALNDVAAIVKALANKKSIRLTVETEDELPLLTADQPKFKQIMYNLISNAIKFTPEGGSVTVQASLDTSGDGSTLAIRIAVADTGIGIKPDDQERIFREFEQVDSSYSRQQQGTGLGLALTRNLIELHGGRIWVESAGIEGKGSTFTFVLPVQAAQTQAAAGVADSHGEVVLPASNNAAPQDGLGIAAPLVLVVEDNDAASELLTHYLSEAGYAVAHAEDGEQAVRMVKELHPYAVTLDIMLPRKDGWQVLAELKAAPETADVPVIIVSMTEDRQLGVSLGAVDFLVKPVDKDRLLETIARAGALSGKAALTILVVDDEPPTVEFLSDLLRHQGYAVLAAYGGQQGIELAVEKLPDIIVLDLMMPEVTGFDVVRRLHEDAATRDIPIIIFSAKDITDEDRMRLNSGTESIVSKSGKEDLLRELERLRAG